MADNEYPKHLLPQQGWRKGIRGAEIVNCCSEAMIGHKIEGSYSTQVSYNLDDEPSLIPEALPTKRIPNLSTNLLGAAFTLSDFKFKTVNNGKETWNETSILEQADTSDYELLQGEMFVVGWVICEVDDLPIPYERSFSDKTSYGKFRDEVFRSQNIYLEEYEKLNAKNKIRYADHLTGKVRLNHDPTNLNYWHFTIDLYPMESDDKTITDTKKAWCKMMADNVGDILRKTFVLIKEQSEIPRIEGWEKLVVSTTEHASL